VALKKAIFLNTIAIFLSEVVSMFDLRKIAIIFVIGVLFSIFVFTSIEAIYPSPDYDDYCDFEKYEARPYPVQAPEKDTECATISPTEDDKQACKEKDGFIRYKYDENNCATEYLCETCQNEFDLASQQHGFVVFVVASILGAIAVALGIYLPKNKDTLNEWIGTGFMLGGLFALFFGTARYFGDLHRIWRPLVILIEMLIVIFVAYKKIKR